MCERRQRPLIRHVLVFCLLLLVAAGCGQKGELYLPRNPPPATEAEDD
ncbi:MAG: lipoprotein [Candidatus Competibacterales bacterium]|nr:lipoprotein [Candidatus Competibacterales bacterium]